MKLYAKRVAQVPDNLGHGRGSGRVAAFDEGLRQVGCRIASRKVDAVDGVRERVAHVDGDCKLSAVVRYQDGHGHDRGGEGVSALGGDLRRIG